MNYALSLLTYSLPFLAALVALGLGILVFLRNPRHPANIGFGFGMFSIVLIEAGDAIFLLSNSGASAMFGKRLSLSGEAILPSSWLLFSLAFARANYKEIISRWKPIIIGLYLGSVFFILWIKSPLFVFLPPRAETYNVLLIGPVGRYFYVFLLLGILINLIHLENTLRFSTGSKREQIKYVLISVGAILSFQIYLVSKALLFPILINDYIPVTSVVILISCGLSLFTIVRHRLFSVNIFISRYIIYNSLTILFVGAYLLIVGLVTEGIKFFGGSFDTFWNTLFIFIAMLGVVAVLLSNRLRRKFQLFVNRHFYKHKYEFRDKWMETIEKIGTKSDLFNVQMSIVEMISETMGAREVYLWLDDSTYKKYVMVASTIETAGQLEVREDHQFTSYIKECSAPFFIKDIIEDETVVTPEISSLIMATKTVLCTPLIFGKGELIGFIFQSEDISGEPYRKDDLDLLKAIASHGANRIKNIYLSREILVAKEAEAFHQVSSFFIHDLKNFVSTLSILTQNAEEHISNPLFQKDVMNTLKITVAKMNSMISNLTLLSRALRINPHPVNLNDILEETLYTLNGQSGLTRIVKHLESLQPILADGEQIRKVLLNLLLNAIEASPADGEINIRIFAKNGEVILSVADKGCGMSQEFIESSLFRPFRTTKTKGLGIGLFQCKKIVEAHKGRIEVESKEGKGSVFRVILPVEMV